MSIRIVRSIHETGRYKPIQAYVDRGVLARFKAGYKSHGDITKLIRNAFAVAISEDEKTEVAARTNIEASLGPAPETKTIELPCELCVYPSICVAEKQCAIHESDRYFENLLGT